MTIQSVEFATPQCSESKLLLSHIDHFVSEEWTNEEISLAISLGVRSISQYEANNFLGYYPPSGGIWFPFSESWGQLRPDSRFYPDGREAPKYCSPKGKVGEGALWIPPNTHLKDLAAVTEGWKDAFIATVRGGVPVGAVAGVSHVRSVVPKGLGTTLLFDSDGWDNADVMNALIKGGSYLNGKVAIIPKSIGEKAGATEFFSKGLGQSEFQELLKRANSPEKLFKSWLDRLLDNPLLLPKKVDSNEHLYVRVRKIASAVGLDVNNWIKKHRTTSRRLWNAQESATQVISLSNAEVGEFEQLCIPKERKLIALNGQKGTSKTSKAIRGLIDEAKRSGKSVLIYTPTRFLSRDTATRFGVACHLDDNPVHIGSKVMVACPESAHKFVHESWDIVILDEANEVLPRSWEGVLGNASKQSREAITTQIKQAQVVVIAQDGLYKSVLTAVERIGNFEKTELIQRRRSPGEMKVFLYSGIKELESYDGVKHEGNSQFNLTYHGWLKKLLDAVSEGGKVALPIGSRGQGRKLQRLLKRVFPEKRIAIIDGRDSFSSLRSEFASSADRWIEKHRPDVLIFTPVFNSGVSIETSYFTHQFEYSAPLESATALSQRGERVRAAIGGGLIKERHVFLQQRGLPKVPPKEIFSPNYWLDLFQKSDCLEGANFMLRKWGLGDLESSLKQKSLCSIQEYPELAKVLAIQAREIHFKEECLMEEWESNGWRVKRGRCATKGIAKSQSELLKAVTDDIIGTRSRALALAPSKSKAEKFLASVRGELIGNASGRNPEDIIPTAIDRYLSKDTPRGPIESVKFQKWDIENILGDIDYLKSPQFWTAFYLDSHGAVGAVQVQALLRLKFEQPYLWQRIQEWAAFRSIVMLAPKDAEIPELPMLPASVKALTVANLLSKCPGIKDMLLGHLSEWNKNTPVVIAAAKWAAENAEQLAAISKRSSRWYGYQFSQRTYSVQAFHKLLSMAGVEVMRLGRVNQIYQYKALTRADVEEALKVAEREGGVLSSSLYRTVHSDALVQAALKQAKLSCSDLVASAWNEVESSLRKCLGCVEEVQKESRNTSEVLPQDVKQLLVPGVSDWKEMRELLDAAEGHAGEVLLTLRELVVEVFGQDVWLRLLHER